MSLFNPEIPKKQKEPSHHPWENRIKDVYSRTYKYGHNSTKNPAYPQEKQRKLDKDRVKFTVIGNRLSKDFIYCLHLVKGLHKYRQKEFDPPIIRGVTSVEWPKVWNDLKIQYGGLCYCLLSEVAILKNGEFLGGIDELKALVESKYVYYFYLDYHKESIQLFANFVKSSGRPFAYLQISIDDKPIGTLIFMLYADLVPNTCENFLRLCEETRGGYGGTPVHRIVEDCWIQCGGFGLKSSDLDCENFIVQHDRRGVLCMANNGRHIDCSTQFFVLLQPAPWMEHKYVAFGQLVEGENTLQKIEKVPTWYESPLSKIVIYKAGVFNMECQNIIINKSTREYLHGHIEDLFTIGKMFYEELLEKVFAIVEQKSQYDEEIVEEEHDAQNVRPTLRFLRKKEDIHKNVNGSVSNSESDDNNDFDVDVYEYEFESYSYDNEIPLVPSIIVNPEKPFYLPLTDVPYPGEVDSTYDLKKFLKGDYCLESDLEKDPVKRKQQEKKARIVLKIPRHVRDSLFPDYTNDDDESVNSVSSIGSDEMFEINEYLKENCDKVSFSGPVINKIANMKKKYDILEDSEGNIDMSQRLLTDEELRLLRLTIKEYKNTRNKKVAINVKADSTKTKKRIPPKPIPEKEYIKRDNGSQLFRSYRRGSADNYKVSGLSAAYRPSFAPPRPSVLARLYENVARDSDDDIEGPTLKDYKPLSELHRKYFMLTHSPTDLLKDDDSRENRRRRSQLEERGLPQVLNLQHGRKVSNKISSDYVRTIDHIEHNLDSLRAFEFARKRPWISVAQYQLKNQKYKEELPAPKSEVQSRDGGSMS